MRNIAALRQTRLEASEQEVELAHIVCVESWTRRAHRSRANCAAPPQDLLANRKPKSRLLLMSHQRQVDIVQVFGFLAEPAPE
jgi:hypothetical protein